MFHHLVDDFSSQVDVEFLQRYFHKLVPWKGDYFLCHGVAKTGDLSKTWVGQQSVLRA